MFGYQKHFGEVCTGASKESVFYWCLALFIIHISLFGELLLEQSRVCYAGRPLGCSLRLQDSAPLDCTNQCKVKAKCSFIMFQLSLLRKWDLSELRCGCLSPFFPHTQWFWTSRHLSNIFDRKGEISKVLEIIHSMKICARLRGKSQLKHTRRKLRKRTLLLDFGKPSWERDVENHASLAWQLTELLVSPNFMIIIGYA